MNIFAKLLADLDARQKEIHALSKSVLKSALRANAIAKTELSSLTKDPKHEDAAREARKEYTKEALK